MSHAPLVSIVINNYNYGRFLRQSIESALNQNYPNYEVLVVDDGSTDDSRAVIESYGTRLSPIFKENGGQASALNRGFLESKGEYILFLDADDALEAHCLETCVKHMTADAARLVYRLTYIDRDSQELTDLNRRIRQISFNNRYQVDWAQGVFEPVAGTPTSGNFFSRKVLEKILPIEPEERFRICADQYLFLWSASVAPVITLDAFLARYRVHGSNNFTTARFDAKTLRTQLLNIINRHKVLSEVYSHNHAKLDTAKQYSGWKDFEILLLAKKVEALRGLYAEIDEDVMRECLRRSFRQAFASGSPTRILLHLYLGLLRVLPLSLAKRLFRIVNAKKFS